MKSLFPTNLNLEFFEHSRFHNGNEKKLLCHVEHDDYGNKIRYVPLQVTSDGHITLDFFHAVTVDADS
jgi:hypothetical protein